MTFLVSCIYLLLPAIGQPLFFDFHENKFIPFFVLWFIWFYLEKKDKRAFLFLILSLMIKEDTPIFLMVFAIYRMVGKKEYKRGGLLLAVSAVYFAVVMIIIGRGGEGLVEGHYSMYYLEGESGLFALAKNIILEPGRFLAQVFDRENLGYIFCTLGALLFVPLACRDKRRLILQIPYVAFALMTAYPSQHNVGFQYTYGPAVLMLLPISGSIMLALLTLNMAPSFGTRSVPIIQMMKPAATCLMPWLLAPGLSCAYASIRLMRPHSPINAPSRQTALVKTTIAD